MSIEQKFNDPGHNSVNSLSVETDEGLYDLKKLNPSIPPPAHRSARKLQGELPYYTSFS